VKVAVLTTSYPRFPGDAAGRFIFDAAERLRGRGLDVEVVAPTSFPHFGIAYGDGVVGNLRRNPARGLLLPPMFAAFVRAARAASRDADVVDAHWLPVGAVAVATRKPFVLHVHGTDMEVAQRAPALARRLLRRARVVIAASSALADEARRLGARDVRVIPTGVDVPEEPGEEAEPPEVLFVGRLSPEKGILELVEAADGMRLVVVGDGPLRARVPQALGMLPPEELGPLYGRAAVFASPSRREGFGVACAEAMAHARPVVAAAVGGLLDLVVHEETGLLVPPRDVPALRGALERLLGDAELRRRLGAGGRERVRRQFSWDVITEATMQTYRDALL
jgi:glycosyltransferase involved in cell wall biosynthesis